MQKNISENIDLTCTHVKTGHVYTQCLYWKV